MGRQSGWRKPRETDQATTQRHCQRQPSPKKQLSGGGGSAGFNERWLRLALDAVGAGFSGP
jgi:hypothetical protein